MARNSSTSRETQDISQAATAAKTAADVAIALATKAAATADALASAKATSDTAAALVASDISHIKADIADIKQTQKDNAGEMKKAVEDLLARDEQYVRQATHQKVIDDHETRIRSNEANITKILTWGSIAVVILGLVEFALNKFLK